MRAISTIDQGGRRTVLAVAIVLTLLAGAGLAHGGVADASEPYAVINNGVVKLGVHAEGHLNVRSEEGIVGLRYVPTGNEATSPGCTCEGWGAGIIFPAGAFGDEQTAVSGSANDASGIFNVSVESMTVTDTTARSVTIISGAPRPYSDDDGGDGGGEASASAARRSMGPHPRNANPDARDAGAASAATGDVTAAEVIDVLRVTHDYAPSEATPNLYQVSVTVENISGVPGEVRYRRAMDWDTEPTPFREFVTIDGSLPPPVNLLYSSNDGFASTDPLSGPSDLGLVGPPLGDYFHEQGPDDHGALFDFGFGTVDPGGNTTFNTFYGAAGDTTGALGAVGAVGAEVWSFGTPSTATPPTGEPNTFIFAFGGVGGDPFAGSDDRPPVFMRVFGERVADISDPDNPVEMPFRVSLRNFGSADATGGVLDIDLPPGVTLLTPDGVPFDVGDVPEGGLVEVPVNLLLPPPTCRPQVFPVAFDFSYNELGETEAPRHVPFDITMPGTCGTLQGHVTAFGMGPQHGAEVRACNATVCRSTHTDSDGFYQLLDMPMGAYDVTALPPVTDPPSDFLPANATVAVHSGDTAVQNFGFGGPTPIPDDMTLEPSREYGMGVPVVYWGEPLTLVKTDQCEGATATWEVRQSPGPEDPLSPPTLLVDSGPMVEDPPGTYTGTIPPFHPIHGYADVFAKLDCPPLDSGDDPFPGPEDVIQGFSIYIDPSGFVRNTLGEPIAGATVRVLYAPGAVDENVEPAADDYIMIPDGSAIMSPANRTNPDLTDAAGHFGWDVVTGWYVVEYSKDGCVAADTGQPIGRSRVMFIPPEVTDLDLRLNCGEAAQDGGDRSVTVSTGDVVDADNPLQVRLRSPRGGNPTLAVRSTQSTDPAGIVLLPVEAVVTALGSTATSPLTLTFRVHTSLLPAGNSAADLILLRDNNVVSRCVSTVRADPDPCRVSIETRGDVITIVAWSTNASVWGLGVPAAAVVPAPPCSGAEEAPFDDVSGRNVHASAIGCLVRLEVVRGVTQTSYVPAGAVTRAQMATFVVSGLAAVGVDLPAGSNAFRDDDGNAHQASINSLAAAGIVQGLGGRRYGPSEHVTRAQMASFLVAAHNYATDEAWPDGGDAFTDDDGNVHEGAIDAAAAADLVEGVANRRYLPDSSVRRDQMATFVARLVNRLAARTE